MSGTPRLRAAATRVDITPADLTGLNPIGGGSFNGVHDPIFARVLLLDGGTGAVALISVDLIEAGDMRHLRARIGDELSAPASHVVIAASHDHSAPRLGQVTPGALAHGGGPEQRAYTDWVYDQLVAATAELGGRLRPARIGFGTGLADVNINRDVPGDGRWELGINPGRASDKTVSVLRVEGEDGEPIATWFCYGVHSTVTLWTGLVSGDLAGAAARRIEDDLGGVALYATGLLGDQAPRVSYEHAAGAEKSDPDFAFRAADAQGAVLGAEVVRVAGLVGECRGDIALWADELVIDCPVKPGEDVMSDMVQEAVDTVPLRLSMVRVGDVTLFGLSGEVVTALGWAIRAALPERAVVISLVNDRIGYLVDEGASQINTFEARGCPVARGCLEGVIVDGLRRMLDAASNA